MRPSNPARVAAKATAVLLMLLVAAVLPGVANAAPSAKSAATAFDLSHYKPVNTGPYLSMSYANGGAHFFKSGRWLCRLGPAANAVSCQGKPGSAPPGTLGVAIAGESQGPYWVRPGTSFRPGTTTPFRAPTLPIGSRINVANVTCAVPSAGSVVCRNWNRGFKLTRYSHRFLYPKGDTAHSANPRR
ncbi:MAG: hypothetical protein WA934_11935 [Gordonia sp. (in: high G+C Gram-positive bacteria)]